MKERRMMEGREDDGRKGGWKEGRMMEGGEDDGRRGG